MPRARRGSRPGRLLARVVLLLAGSGAALACANVLTDQSASPVTDVRLTPDSMDLPIGTAGRIRAYPVDATGALRPGQRIEWSSEDPQVASVDDTGGVVGVGAGTVGIVVTVHGIQSTARVRVGTAPAIGLAADSIRFDAEAGQGSPPPQTVAISNVGGLTLSGLTVGVISYGPGAQAWLLASLDTTVAPATLTLTAATGAVTSVGTYTATVPIVAPGASNTAELQVYLVVAPGPPTSYQMTVAAGDNQLVPAGTAVPVAPTVVVTDSFANPIVGLPVTFMVTLGGGNATGLTVATDANGKASVGSWTVEAAGSVPADGRFTNQLQANAPSTSAVTFTAFAYFNYTSNIHGIWAAQSCNGCHGPANLGGLTLSNAADVTYTGELFDVPAACGGGSLKQVSAAGGITGENASILMAKLDHTAPAACPGGMPNDATFVPAATRDTIRAWIRAGAPLN